MKFFLRNLVLLIAIFITLIGNISSNQEIQVPENVTELNDNNFEEFINENNLVLVLFYNLSDKSKRIIQGLGDVASAVMEASGTGKIALVNSLGSSIVQRMYIRNLPKLIFFYGNINKYDYYPNHLSGLEKESMISIILSKENSPFIEYDSRNSESLEKAMLEFNLEGKIHSSNLPVLVYYGKKDTKRTEVVKNTLNKLRETGVPIRAFIVYVKYKADIGLHIYRLPEVEKHDAIEINPKELYIAKKKILGLLEWNEQILSVFVEACIRPYVSFRGNELMYIHESSNSLITFLKGSNTLDKYGSSNIKYLDHELMESLRAIAKANFFPEDPDNDLMIGLVLPGLEQEVENFTGFYRNDHVENGTFLLKLRKSKFQLENSGKSNKYLFTEEEVKKHGLKYFISQAKSGNLPIFYKSKRVMGHKEVSKNVEQYFTTPFNYLELNPLSLMELIQDKNNALIVFFYTEMCSRCNELLSFWNSFSSKIASNLNKESKFRVFVSAFDLELNDNPINMEVKEIPVIYYFPFGDNKVSKMMLYTDELTLEAATTFINDRIAKVSQDEPENLQDINPSPQVKDEL